MVDLLQRAWCWIAIAAVLAEGAAAAGLPPNIVYILCDDLGYGDVRSFHPASRIPTPHLDRLAAEGMRFTDMHSGSSVCTPTRYGIMTGRYAWRSRLQQGVLGGLSPRLIEPGRLTVPALLRQHGYHTACIGKWHLGLDWVVRPGKSVTELNIEPPDQVWNVDYAQPFANGPNALGFDYYFGIAASLDMVPYTFLRNDRVAELPTEDRSFAMMLGREGGTTRQGPAAAGFDAAEVLPELTRRAVAYVRERSESARRGQPFFLYLPLASPHTPILPTSAWSGRSGLNPYADFVMETDAAIGRVLESIAEAGMTRQTLVIVTSDNGCSPQARFDELSALGHNPSGPWRGHKADIYEGGHRIPFLVRWPGEVAAGTSSSQLLCLTDLMATCAELLNVPLPPEAGEDSVSFLPALRGHSDRPLREAVVHHSINGSFAIRQGPWKLALCPGSGGWSAPRPGQHDTSHLPLTQLFQLDDDLGETVNVQDRHPEVVARLTALLERYVSQGRSTPGAPQANQLPVDIWKAARAAHQPPAGAARRRAAK